MRVTSGTVRPARTVLVTGGAGFIGRSLCAALVARGDHVHLVDLLPGARQRCAVTALPAVEVTAADLATAALRELLLGVDVVVHLAARPGVQPSWGSGFEHYLRDNAIVTQRLLEAVGERRVVIASSSSVYGEVAHGAVTEDAPLRPLSPYGVSKVAAEMLVHTYVALGVDAVVLRYFSVYGRHQRPDMAVARIVDAAATGTPFSLRGDGSQCRDLTHVDDVVAATIAALDARIASGTVINVGSGRPVELRTVIAEVSRQTGVAVPVTNVPETAGDPARTAADRRRAAELLGWAPVIDLADGIADQIEAAAVFGHEAETVA